MRCGVSGAVQSHGSARTTRGTARQRQHAYQSLTQTVSSVSRKRLGQWDTNEQRTERRNTRSAAGLILPDPATGTCLIHNICHFASAIIIVLATVRNVPQLVKCWRSKSAFGLSAAALATEVSCYACTVAYGVRRGYAMTLWGSEMACWLQDMTLLGLVARLRGVNIPIMTTAVLGSLALKSLLFTELVPMWFLSKLQIFVGLILGLGARVPQIILNHRNGHTGNLALPTYIFNSTANLVCCTSTAIITGDIYVMIKEIWMLSLNTTIVSQILRTLAKDRAAERKVPDTASRVLPRTPATLPTSSSDGEEMFRSHSMRLAGNFPRPRVAGDQSGDVKPHRRRGVIGPPSWSLDSPGLSSHSLDADNSSALDEYAGSSVDKRGSMDGMRTSLA